MTNVFNNTNVYISLQSYCTSMEQIFDDCIYILHGYPPKSMSSFVYVMDKTHFRRGSKTVKFWLNNGHFLLWYHVYNVKYRPSIPIHKICSNVLVLTFGPLPKRKSEMASLDVRP